MTTDEELNVLDTQLRRLKIEYEIYFSNPTKKPPADIEWKVLALLRKFSDGGRMNFSQRFRYNEMAQRYAIYSDLWRKKSRIREEGYRRPQDAILSIQGVRTDEDRQKSSHPANQVSPGTAPAASTPTQVQEQTPVVIQCSNPEAECDKVETLYNALSEAKARAGAPVSGNLSSFASFVKKKTDQIRKKYGCHTVEYTVEMEDGQVRLKAKAKV